MGIARGAVGSGPVAPVPARTLLDVLPRAAEAQAEVQVDPAVVLVHVAGRALRVGWADDGTLRQVRELVAEDRGRYDVVTARHLSLAARELLSDVGLGWADQTGAAEIVADGLVVARPGRPPSRRAPRRAARGAAASATASDRRGRWTPVTTAVVEALLVGVPATVAATAAAVGISVGAATRALRVLTDQGLLVADAARGRRSGRRIGDPGRLLDAHSAAVDTARRTEGLEVGLTGRDLVAALAPVGRAWDAAGIRWAATGVAAAAVLAPLLTDVARVEVYVDAATPAALDARAADAGLRPIAGGRLTLRPFPTPAIPALARRVDDLRVAPWPRVHADLRRVGVRGEEAAEHLRDVMTGR